MLHTIREICTNKLGSWNEGKRVAKPFQGEMYGNSSNRTCICIVCFGSTITSLFYLAFSSYLLKRLGKDLLAVSFPQSCLDSL